MITGAPLIIGAAGGTRIYKFKQTRFWAENGLVRTEDGEGAYRTRTVREWLQVALAFSDTAKALSRQIREAGNQARRLALAEERDELIRHVETMVEVAKQAREQGDPHMPGVIAQVAHDRRSIRSAVGTNLTPRPSKLILPGV